MPSSLSDPDAPRCELHNVVFRKYHKDGDSWWSHKNGDIWCNRARETSNAASAPSTPATPPSGVPSASEEPPVSYLTNWGHFVFIAMDTFKISRRQLLDNLNVKADLLLYGNTEADRQRAWDTLVALYRPFE